MTNEPGTVDAVTQIVARIQNATQHELVDEFLALFRPDAIWTTGGGKRLIGIDEIAACPHFAHNSDDRM